VAKSDKGEGVDVKAKTREFTRPLGLEMVYNVCMTLSSYHHQKIYVF